MASSVLLLDRYANCRGSRSEGSIWHRSSLTRLSKHLLTTGVRAIGRQSFKQVIFCCLGMGMMVLNLKQAGTEERERDRLNMSANTLAN